MPSLTHIFDLLASSPTCFAGEAVRGDVVGNDIEGLGWSCSGLFEVRMSQCAVKLHVAHGKVAPLQSSSADAMLSRCVASLHT